MKCQKCEGSGTEYLKINLGKCTECRGSGQLKDHSNECPDCKGTGRNAQDPLGKLSLTLCMTCLGSGKRHSIGIPRDPWTAKELANHLIQHLNDEMAQQMTELVKNELTNYEEMARTFQIIAYRKTIQQLKDWSHYIKGTKED